MRRHLFTLGLLLLLPISSVAHADRVVLLPPGGTAPQEELDRVEEALAEAVLAAGHESVTESGAIDRRIEPPTTGNELRAVAEMQSALYAVVTAVDPESAGRYRLMVRVGYAPEGRVEELTVVVLGEGEAERLRDVLSAMLRAEGVGEDADRLRQDPAEAAVEEPEGEGEGDPDAEEEARREEEAREEFEARERERAEEERQRQQDAWDNRERYGERSPWMVNVGVDIRPLISHQADRTGGVLGGASIRLGRSLGGLLPGLELRGAFDIVSGAASGFTVAAGAAYLYSPFESVPVFLGGSVELGVFQSLSGNRVPSMVVRVAPTAVYRLMDNVYLEGSVLEVQYFSANEGAASLGFSVRGGVRF